MKLTIIGHGNFATGILSSLELIAGKQEKVEAIDFTEGMSADDVRDRLSKAIADEKEVLVLCDLLGGTPFNVASAFMSERVEVEMDVLSGLNLAMLMEAAFGKDNHSLEELAGKALVAAKSGLVSSRVLFANDIDSNETSFETGI